MMKRKEQAGECTEGVWCRQHAEVVHPAFVLVVLLVVFLTAVVRRALTSQAMQKLNVGVLLEHIIIFNHSVSLH